MKTIKQIADELGVSKQSIRNTIAKLGLQTTLRKNGNSFAIDNNQESLIKREYSEESQSDLQSESQSNMQSALRLLERQNEQLSGELAVKNKLIDEQQQTIKKLADALATSQQTAQAAQALHAGTIQNQLPNGRADSAATSEKKIWFARIFSKKI